MKRRRFFQLTAAAASTPAAAPAPGRITEPTREVPVKGEYDVLVCGGGPAGSMAAIAAARAGARTRLIESQGSVGGVWTSGLMTEFADAANKKGLVAELVATLRKRGAMDRGRSSTFDPEIMKHILETFCREAGIEVRLHTMVVGAVKDARGRLTHAITESKSGREAWAAKCFVDASGDGDLAAWAGCGFDFAHPETKEFQPSSLRCLVGGLTDTGTRIFTDHSTRPSPLWKEIQRGGHEPTYIKSNFFLYRPGVAGLMANQEYGQVPADAEAMSKATLKGRDELNRVVEALRSLGGNWKDIWLAAPAEMIGMREIRRIHGLYTLTVEDVTRGARFDDAVCRSHYGINLHSYSFARETGTAGRSTANPGGGLTAKPFDIPLRSLIAKDVSALMMAGRCISGDHYAHGSYRVTGNAAAMGAAAGRTAALAAKSNRLPQQVNISELKLQL
jgi:hypothetical protein